MGSRSLLPCAGVPLLVVIVALSASAEAAAAGRYRSVFSFGDSYADTGNNPVVFRRLSVFDPVTRPPYGFTFFGRPTGRDCDGRLPIDFVAGSLGLPLVPAYLAHNGSFRGGANFAVGGATALDAAFFHRDDPPGAPKLFPLNTSLAVQLQWFEALKPSLCATTKECRVLFGRSLFFVGAFGANDYLLSLANKTVHQVRSLVPDVVSTISTAVERLIKHGARSVVVPGVIPMGCAPPVLVTFVDPNDPAGGYDRRTGCLTRINELAAHHNALLQHALRKLRAKHHAGVVYADFFGPVMDMVTSPAKFGLAGDVLTLCCGGPGKYNYNKQIFCGDAGATTCKDPSARLFWDGVHLTEAAYRHVAASWMTGAVNSPPATAASDGAN